MAACSPDLVTRHGCRLGSGQGLIAEEFVHRWDKIESVANKYTFVWKKSVTKRQAKVLAKFRALFLRPGTLWHPSAPYTRYPSVPFLRRLLKLKRLQRKKDTSFSSMAARHRKTPLQKAIEKAKDFLHKTKEYVQSLHYCGDRNSGMPRPISMPPSMHLKEDAMKNGRVKPAYNVYNIAWTLDSLPGSLSDRRLLIVPPCCLSLERFFAKHFPSSIPVSLQIPKAEARRKLHEARRTGV